ncbi:MAG: discoidin domain-containing protein, partial [Ideonella sp.]|nr:discoidin domain-containing protein [Ideonella sp.]
GTYLVSAFASNPSARTSTNFVWKVSGNVSTGSPVTYRARYVQIEQLSELSGGPWGAMAEFNLVDANGSALPRTGWNVSADSEETSGENGRASNVLDGNPATHWHSRYSGGTDALPHRLTFDLGSPRSFGGFRYLPRQGGGNGTFGQYRVWLSHDGIAWSAALASGDLALLGPAAAEKQVMFMRADGAANGAPSVTTPDAQTTPTGSAFSLAVSARDPDFDVLAFSASGLPPGLSINVATGVISGTPTASGSYSPRVTVSDGRGGSATTGAIAWTVAPAPPPAIQPLVLPIATTGNAITLGAAATGIDVTYSWDFGDGSAPTGFSSSPTVTRTFAVPGLYTVTLTARSAGGALSTAQGTLAVARQAAPGRAQASSTIAVATASGQPARLWVVNPDQDTVTVFDAGTMMRLAEPAVGARPSSVAVAPDGRVWVANRDSATLSVFDAFDRAPRTVPLPRASRPHGVVFGIDGRGYVALEGTGEVQRLNADGSLGPRLPVGPAPRDLSITADGARVLVSRFITPPLPGEGTANVDVSPSRGAEVVVVSTATFSVQGTTVLRHSEREDSTVQGRGIPNYLGAPVIAPDGLSAWVPSKQDNVRRGMRRDGLPLDFQNTVRAITSRIDLSNPASPIEDHPARIDHDNASVASAAVFHPSGAYLFVALETSRQVAVVDPAGRRELFRAVVGQAPQGLVVSPDGRRLYVGNFMDRSVTVLDLDSLISGGERRLPVVATAGTVASERLAPAVLRGKQLFYDALDPRLARDSYMSCASCHRDGGHDGRTWDLTGFGEGLRRTPSLMGRAGMRLGALHWSGNFDEVQDFEGQIRALAGGQGLMADADLAVGTRQSPLGDRKAGVSPDLDALAAYVSSLSDFAPSPARDAAGGLTADGLAGREVFRNLSCATCHGGSAFSNAAMGLALQDVGTVKPTSGSRLGAPLSGLKASTLRDLHLYRSYLHDGSAATVADAVRAHAGITDAVLAAADPARATGTAVGVQATEALRRLSAYLVQIGREEPAPEVTLGLQGAYFANASFTGTPITRRPAPDDNPILEPWLDLDWLAVPTPAAPAGAPFSLRLTGSVAPASTGEHVFRVTGGGGTAALWIDGMPVPLG